MVEYNYTLDDIFLSLADSTRRDILRLLKIYDSMSVGEIALHYKMTFAGVSKHLKVLENAKLVKKTRRGKHQIVRLSPKAFSYADAYISDYHRLWDDRLNRLEVIINEKEQ